MNKERITTVLRVLSGVLVVALTVALLLKASQTAELQQAEATEKTPIVFSAQVDGDGEQLVAKTDDYSLYADLSDPAISLVRNSDGAAIYSRPQTLETLELKRASEMALSSLLNIRYADRDSNITEVNSVAGCVSRDSFSATRIANGVRFEFYFKNEGFLVPLEITLDENGLNATVPLDDIQEASEDIRLTEIVVLPNFGAGQAGTDGYAVVPDGSGATVPFTYGLANYRQRVYGDDEAVGRSTGVAESETARLPVFGITDTKQAVTGIITAGDSRAYVAATAATERSPFTTVCAEFVYRERLLINISQQTFESTQANMFEPGHCELESFSVSYRMPSAPDYVGMANTYRQYLINEKRMTVDASSADLQVQVVGGVMHEENILGIPVDRVLTVTAYEDVLSLTDALAARGVENLTIDYLYWYKNGTESRLTSDMKAESRLGGTKGLKAMLSALAERDVPVYFDLNFTDLMHNQSGYTTLFDTAQNVKKEPLSKQTFYLSTYREDTDAADVFLLNPAKLSSLVSQWNTAWQKNWQSAGMNRFSLNSLGSSLYSHFGDDPLDRGVVQGLIEETLQSVGEQTDSLLFTAANAYALPYASVVQEVPVEHSGYFCEEKSIPFYTIALHGLVDMSVPAVNAGEPETRFLQAVESGVGLTYTLGWQNTGELKNTAGETFRYIKAENWLDLAAKQQTAIQPYLEAVAGCAVSAHEQLATDVFRTVFDNGVWAVVNYSEADFVYNGTTVSAGGYLTGGF